jgi:predicted acylesterase/phospholipase RssA
MNLLKYPIDELVLSGGGLKGFYQLGSLYFYSLQKIVNPNKIDSIISNYVDNHVDITNNEFEITDEDPFDEGNATNTNIMTSSIDKDVNVGLSVVDVVDNNNDLNVYGNEDTIDYFNLKYTKRIIGTSVGAIVGLLLQCGYSPLDIYSRLVLIDPLFDISKIRVLKEFKIQDLMNLFNITKYGGVLDIDDVLYHVDDMVRDRLKKIPTLQELYDMTGIYFEVVVTQKDKESIPLYISHLTHPTLSAVEAAKMSANLPIAFKYKYLDGKKVVDGGLCDNCPCDRISPLSKNVLVIYTPAKPKNDGPNVPQFFLDNITISINTIAEIHLSNFSKYFNANNDRGVIIKIDPDDKTTKNDVGLIQNIETKMKKHMFKKGYRCAKKMHALE